MALLFAASIIPILALVARYIIAVRYIDRNHCGIWMKRFQWFTLCGALFYLLCFESLLITFQDLPGANKLDAAAVLFLLTAYVLYLIPMAFVLYPGKDPKEQTSDLPTLRTNYFGGEEYP